jgi:peptide/nickel transport system substrate-binding protein
MGSNYWQNRVSRRRLIRRAAGGGLVVTTAGVLACSRASRQDTANPGVTATGTPQPGGTYNGQTGTGGTLDPQAISRPPGDLVASGVMSRLFRYKTGPTPETITNHDVEPDLALSAESPDAVTWTFRLRPNATFHNVAPVNGHAVQAEDVKSTIARALSLTQNPNRGALGMIDPTQIETPDAQTVIFKLNYAYAPFQKTVASPQYAWIFPREALAGDYDPSKVMIGSGPFTLVSANPDVSYQLKKNPNWFQSAQPYIDGVNQAVIADNSQLLAQFSTAHLDETTVLPNDLASMKQQNPKAAAYKLPPAAVGTLFFPLGDSTSAFQDIRVRQGLSMAIDYDAIGKSVFNGEFTRCLFVSPSLGKWSLSLDQLDASVKQNYQYNPGEAKKLLDAAGATGQTFKFAFINSGVSPSQSWAITEAGALANMFQAAGMKLQQLPIDFTKDYIDTGKGYRQGYFDKDVMFFFNAQTFNEVDEAIYNYFDSKSTQSGEHLQDSALDDMIAKARTVVDENQRLQAYLDIQKYIASKVYTLVLGGGPNYTMVQPRVQNYAVSTSYTAMAETYAKVWLQ